MIWDAVFTVVLVWWAVLVVHFTVELVYVLRYGNFRPHCGHWWCPQTWFYKFRTRGKDSEQ